MRYNRIGSADAAAVLGKNPYQTRLDIWRKKVEKIDLNLDDNTHILRGNYIEPEIERWVRDNLDPTVNSKENFKRHHHGTPDEHQISLKHHKYDYITGHLDGIGDNIVWEFKAPAMRNYEYHVSDLEEGWSTWYDIERHGVSMAWILQVHHGLMITGLEYGCLAIWNYDEWRPFIYKIRRDEDLYEKMEDEYVEFWHYVQTKEPPPAITKHEYEQIEVIHDDELDRLLREYDAAKTAHYENKDRQADLKVRILTVAETLGIEGTMITDNYRANISLVDAYGRTYKRLMVKHKDD